MEPGGFSHQGFQLHKPDPGFRLRTVWGGQLPELAVLAASAINAGSFFKLCFENGLTCHTQLHTRQSLASRLRYFAITLHAGERTVAARQLTPGSLDLVFDASVDLILDCPVFCPAPSHDDCSWFLSRRWRRRQRVSLAKWYWKDHRLQ